MSAIDSTGRDLIRAYLLGAQAVVIFLAAACTQARAQAPEPDPPLKVTIEMRESFVAICENGVQSIDARSRPGTQYAYIYCAVLEDEMGREIPPVVYCERGDPQTSWDCREHKTNVRATVAGRRIAFSFEYATLEQSLAVISFLLVSPRPGYGVPNQWEPDRVTLYQGRFLVSGHADSERYSFEVREAPADATRFEVLQVSKCRIDTCRPIWSADAAP